MEILKIRNSSTGEWASIPAIKGDKGEKGDKGDKGENGYTPVKGVDYFTDADKQELIQDILSALPKTEEVDTNGTN